MRRRPKRAERSWQPILRCGVAVLLAVCGTASLTGQEPPAGLSTRVEVTQPSDLTGSVLETAVPETSIPETSIPETSIPQSASPSSTDLQTSESVGDDQNATVTQMSDFALEQAESWVTPDRMSSSAQVFITMALLGVIPALLLMTTSYVRVVVVLGLLRQAFGAQQMLPAQVTTAIAMFITVLVMWPTWERVYYDAVEPYTNEEVEMDVGEAWAAAEKPIREFMSSQIKDNENSEDVWLFLRYLPDVEEPPTVYDEVPLRALLPAFMLSELKTAFLIGFGIYLPFLVIDLFVSAVTTSMGMFMLPPAMISMPLKLLLFVLVDGWNLVVGMLLESFQTYA